MEKEKGNLISIIVPVHNMEGYLGKCLDSLVGQSHRHLEILLIDDGSTDESGAICDRYAAGDGRIKVVHRENGGLSAARNTGLDLATGDYIGFVDSDDWLEHDMYEFLLRDLLDVGADIAVCGFYRTYDHGEEPNDPSGTYRVLSKEDALELLLQDGILQNFYWCKLYKREVLEGIRMPEGKVFEDAFTQHLVFEKAKTVVLHNIPKYHYLQRPDSICGKIKDFINDDFHEAFRERVRYFSARGDKRLYRQAAITYLNHLYWNYHRHAQANNRQACAAYRQKYVSFRRLSAEARFPRLKGRFVYDLVFSGSPAARSFVWLYGRYHRAKKFCTKGAHTDQPPGTF